MDKFWPVDIPQKIVIQQESHENTYTVNIFEIFAPKLWIHMD